MLRHLAGEHFVKLAAKSTSASDLAASLEAELYERTKNSADIEGGRRRRNAREDSDPAKGVRCKARRLAAPALLSDATPHTCRSQHPPTCTHSPPLARGRPCGPLVATSRRSLAGFTVHEPHMRVQVSL